jgi:methylenetetrahydrofolate reductase (NADPH)
LCAEIIQQLLPLAGVSGVHVMAPAFEQGIPEILERAGIARREPGQAEPGGSGAAAAAGEVRRHAH